jgi:glutathione-regulated potassium-efflux system protein KefB
VLQACNAGEAQAILVCVEKREATDKIVEVLRAEFPLARVLVRSFDRQHALKLIAEGVEFQVRETFESALRFGEAALLALGASAEEAAEISLDVRRRDAERFQLEVAGGIGAGNALLRGNTAKPTPFTAPSREARALSEETAIVTQAEEPQAG